MKICIVQGAFLPVPPLMGGAVEKVWFGLAQEFARLGHGVAHISRRHADLPDREFIAGVEHRRVKGYASPKWMGRRLVLDFLYSRRALAAVPPADVVVTNTFWMPVLLQRQRKNAARIYVHVARFPKHQLGLYHQVDRLQTVSSAVARAMKVQAPALAEKIAVVPNPLPTVMTTVRARREVNPRQLLYAGRVHPEKGIDLLITACLGLNCGYQLRIVGPWKTEQGGGGATYWNQLNDLAARSSGKVQLVGPVFNEHDLQQEMADAGVFVYPSLAANGESFGLAPLEAMAHGCVPLVSDLECFEDFIQPGINGHCFNRMTGVDGLRLKLNTLLNDSGIGTTSAKAQQTAARFALPSVAQLYLNDFKAVTHACN